MNEDIEKLELQIKLEKFRENFKHGTFSQRNTHLGKMFNCQICNRRHRQAIKCEQRFVKSLEEGSSRFKLVGKAPFKGKRINPHYSQKRLQLVQLTQQYFPEHQPYWQDPINAMKLARRQAREFLEKKRKKIKQMIQHMQHTSRRINRGLLPAGSR